MSGPKRTTRNRWQVTLVALAVLSIQSSARAQQSIVPAAAVRPAAPAWQNPALQPLPPAPPPGVQQPSYQQPTAGPSVAQYGPQQNALLSQPPRPQQQQAQRPPQNFQPTQTFQSLRPVAPPNAAPAAQYGAMAIPAAAARPAPANSAAALPAPSAVQRTNFQQQPALGFDTNPAQRGQQPPASTGELPPPGTAGVPAWTLEQIEATTLQYNPILRRSVARIDSARGDAQQASLYPNPRFDTNNPEVFAGQNSSYNVGFMQDIVVKGKLRLDRAAANEVVRQKEHGLTSDRFTMLLAVRQQFYTVLVAQRRLEVLGELRDVAAAAVRAAEGRVQATEGTVSEVLLLQTELQRAEIAQRNAQTVLDAGRRQLAAIVGRPDLRLGLLAGELTSGYPNFNEDALREFVVSRNAQVQIARREIERNQILLRRARVEPYPNVRVGPGYSNNVITQPGSQQFWMTLQFDIPTWNRNQGNIRSTQADIADAIASLGVLQNDLLRQVEDVLGRYHAARQSEERIRTQILPTARRAQQLVKDGYQKGILDVSTFLQAQRALNEAALSYLEAVQDVWETGAEIAALLQLERFP